MIKIDLEYMKDGKIEIKGSKSELMLEIGLLLDELGDALPEEMWLFLLCAHTEKIERKLKNE